MENELKKDIKFDYIIPDYIFFVIKGSYYFYYY